MKQKLAKKILGFVTLITTGVITMPSIVMAQEDLFTKGQSMFQTLYLKILGISTGAAVCVITLALLMAMFGDQKSSATWISWAKRALICWAVINGLGFIMTLAKDLLDGGQIQFDKKESSVIQQAKDVAIISKQCVAAICGQMGRFLPMLR